MSGPTSAGLAIAILFILILLRFPIALALMLVGGIGFALLTNISALLNMLNSQAYWQFSSYDLSVVPLFIMMGQLATRSGLSRELFDGARAWLGHYRGGMAMAAIAGCAGFGAICGSSLATAATMGKVSLPELRRYGYSDSLATGALAAGGTLGILIPPSVLLVIYSITVEANIVTMFQAAMLPGLLAGLGYIFVIAIVVRISPVSGPAGNRMSIKLRFKELAKIWPIIFIFLLVIGGIYFGFFTPTEAASVGVVLTGLFALFRRKLGREGIKEVLLGTMSMTAAIFMIVLGAQMFSAFLALTQLTTILTNFFITTGFSPYTVLIIMLIILIFMGCVMDSISMIFLTIPIFWPILAMLDFGLTQDEVKIWFGVIALVVIEMGLITPPIGMNVFIINNLNRNIPIKKAFIGVLPFLASDILRVLLLICLPIITLWLPHKLS